MAYVASHVKFGLHVTHHVRKSPKKPNPFKALDLEKMVSDIVWDLALPLGADRDHEFSNPFKALDLEKMVSEGWRVLVTGYQGDPLVDRQMDLVKLLTDKGVSVMEDFKQGGSHGIEFFDHSFAPPFYHVLKKFILAL